MTHKEKLQIVLLSVSSKPFHRSFLKTRETIAAVFENAVSLLIQVKVTLINA